jgi:hypothetical protein
MVIAEREKNELRRAFNKLLEWAKQNEYRINKKTVTRLFRKGGRTAITQSSRGGKLKMVSSFKYLGIIIQNTGFTHMQHIKDRVIAAVRAMQDIKNLTLLSLTQQ